MAKMIDNRPSWKGEGKVWDSLEHNLPSNFIVYNQREVNGREFDFCVMAEDYGLLVIEVKGWTADTVTVNGVDNIDVTGYDESQTSPKKQARAYRFAILNKISEKFNASPLVLDVVCYPFITEKQYKEIHLDIVSEPTYTLFKEDIENGDLLFSKIQNVFSVNQYIPHAEFSYELMFRIRRTQEPDIIVEETHEESSKYSILRVLPYSLSESLTDDIISNYFAGTKVISFVGNQSDYDKTIMCLNKRIKHHNIDFRKNNLVVGYEEGIDKYRGTNEFTSFNFAIYYVPNLNEVFSEEVTLSEGKIENEYWEKLVKLSERTSFNLQQYMVEHANTEADILVEAGAGTGKTYSMVSRIAFLCNKEADAITNIADEIAMVTFTNDAALNMKKRIKQLFVNYFILTGHERFLKYVEDIDRTNISTIHKFAIGILRGESLYTGLGTNFRISTNEYERGKAYDLFLSEFLEEKEAMNPNFVNELPVPIYDLKKKIMNVADRLFDKSANLSQIKVAEMGTEVDKNIPFFNELLVKVVFPAEATYLEALRASNDVDLKECLIELGRIFSSGCKKIEDLQIKYLFVDEFQDTDDVQIEIFQKLQKCMNANCRLFVVGDLKQSIYRFRGAKLNAFQKLQNGKEKEWNLFRLNRNYRTDGRLLSILDDVFSEMGGNEILPYKGKEDQLVSDVITEAKEEELLVELPCHGKDEEKILELLCDTILKEEQKIEKISETKKLSKEERTIAILVRSNWQVDNVQKYAATKDINVEVNSGGDLYQYISSLDLFKLILALKHRTNPVYLVNFIESNYVKMKLNYADLHGMSEKEKIVQLTTVLDTFFMRRMNLKWDEVIEKVYSQPILYVLKEMFDSLQPWENYSQIPNKQRLYIANYEYLLEKIIKFSRIDALTLNQVAEYLGINILTGQHQLGRTFENDDEGIHIICTTVHKSKGLEYGTVILPYTYEDISDIKKVKLEANYSDDKLAYTVLFENDIREHNSNYDETKEVDEQVAEEARILYVALTRTIRNCVWINNIDVAPHISWSTILEG